VSLPRVYGRGGQMRNPMGEEWGVGADALATALVGLYGPNRHGELVTLYTSGDPARYDDELVDALKLRPAQRTARAVMVALMGGGALGESRVWAHFMQFQNWLMAGVGEEVADVAVGESQGT
jgi:hypothetical protein